MDGNGRWARQRDKPRHYGHREGVKSVRRVVEGCRIMGVEVLTLFAFSSENWKRPKQEVGVLMELFMSALRKEVKRLDRNNVALRIIGARDGFSEKLQQQIAESEKLTVGNDGMLLQVAANYGGRWDIAEAARKLAHKVAKGELDADQVDEQAINAHLSSPHLPDPDLFIRTGGELRISNFLLWQSAYAELYFTPTLWPDFDDQALRKAVADFQRRQRRFGLTGEQVEGTEQPQDPQE
jgi:undecaprenyl diphosphate synthase